MVSNWWTRAGKGRARINRKFTSKSGSIDSSANFPRIKLKAITSDLSRTVSSTPRTTGDGSDVLLAAYGILARARARAAAARQNARIGKDAAAQRARRGAGGDRRSVRHEPVLQAPARGLRGRRPGRHRDRR